MDSDYGNSAAIDEIAAVETVSFMDDSQDDENNLSEALLGTHDSHHHHHNNNNNNDDEIQNRIGDPNQHQNCLYKCQTLISSCFQPIFQIYADQSGSCKNLSAGLSIAASAGILLGIIIPKNPNLPSPLYQYISSMIGYTYFVSWSISFYPQIITNYRRKRIDGLSVDASILAVLNYTCYTTYTAFFFWDETIRQEYKDRNGQDSEVTVMSNDVAFAVNSLLLTSITLGQVIYYKGFESQPMSRMCGVIVVVTFVIAILNIGCILMKIPGFLWIDFLYMMGTIKLILTIMTYVPQITLNFRRKSTEGFNIWNVIFDFSGGVLSLMQLYFDCLDMNDFSGILGNWAKFVLSLITLVFDGIMFLQHYVLYRDNGISSLSSSSLNGDLTEDEALYSPMDETSEDGEETHTEFV